MSVVFAMLASYFLSRTLVPTMVHYMLGPEVPIYATEEGGHAARTAKTWVGMADTLQASMTISKQFRERYRRLLEWSLHNRDAVLGVFAVFVVASSFAHCALSVKTSSPTSIPARCACTCVAPAGTRIESTEQVFAQVEAEIRHIVPPEELQLILDNIGLPTSGINLAFSDSATIGNSDGDILIALNPEKHGPTREYMRRIRADLNAKFPQETFFFTAANMTTQILNFGLPAPIDVQIVGRDAAHNYEVTQRLLDTIRACSRRGGRAHSPGNRPSEV